MQEDKQFEADRPGYQLTKAQENAFKALVAAADEMTDRIEEAGRVESREGSLQSQSKDPALARIDRLCLELCMTLLNYELGNDEYKSVIISGLAILGFRDNRGWLNAEDYTTKYSRVIKIARMLVVYRLHIE